MNKILSIAMLFIFSISLYAQKDVTKFLGIPVDGTKSEMIQKLKKKGYTSSPVNKDVLVGEFNGTDVNIHIVTNNNQVYRIMISDATPIDEGSIKIRFNNLCQQFKDNKNYTSLKDYTLSNNEDISYEMSTHSKKYDALYFQNPLLDSVAIVEEGKTFLLSKYTEEQLSNPSEELEKDIGVALFSYVLDKFSKKPVWFRIVEYYGKYYITMFYDNEYNKANGDDL